ncbi:retrotransposon protein, putative, ty1-copia subclass [Tanacetum coccineum]
MNQNFYNSSGFDQFQPPQYPVIHHPPQETSVQARENLMKSIQTFLKKFNRISFTETPKVLLLAWENFFEIKHAFKEKQHQPEDIQELLRKLLKDLQIISEELADYINTPNWRFPAFYDNDDKYDDEEYTIAITTVLPTMEPDNSLSMGDEHLSIIPKTESDEVIKSSVEDLVPIPSESEGIFDNTCDVHFCDNSPPHDVLNDHFKSFFDFNDDCTSSDDDSFEDIDYVEASPPDTELVSLEEVKDDILREKLLNINLLIAKIESLNDNPTPDCVLKSPSPFPIPVEDSDSFFEKSDTSLSYSDNSLPEFETFSDHTEETSSGSTTTHSDNSLLEYESFLFEIEPDQGELTSVVMEDILGEPRVHVPNVLPTHPTLMLNSDFIPFDDSLGSDLEVSFPSGTRNKIFDPGIFFEVQSKSFLSHLSVILSVQIAPDYEASCAHGFVLRSLELKSLMALPVQNINHSAFRSMFEKEKLSGNNFNDWFARLKLVLRVEKKMHVIEQPLPPAPEPVAEPDIVAQWTALYDAHTEIACLMLGSMTPELHRQFEMHYPYDMIQELRSMFEKQAGVEKFDLIQSFHACKQEEGKPIADYVDERICGETGTNYNMHNMGKTIGEIHAMLIEYEKGLPKKAETPQVMMIKGSKIQKANKKSLNAKGQNKVEGKGKDKKVYIPKPKNPKPTAMEHPAKDDACHHCKEVGHWKRNCLVYLAELLKKKKQVGSASSSSIFTIELFSFPNNNSWVYDTGCGTHICITKQGFRIERKLKQGALYLYVGNRVRAQVEAIGSFDLVLPNGLVICLDNCHYAPTITRGVVSVSKNDVLYFNAIARNGIYEIDMHDLVPNVNSIYNVSNKRVKHNLDSTYLWHCRLAHINKKRIKQLQQDGLLKSTDDESFDKCESCLSGKMTKKPFPHSNERAKDLLGIIHTDVCGPLRHVSRQGASYFITFTDDYSRYGYVYLLKHKHEVFETFKVFKNEVENQLGKTIKAIRSDCGGEYISQEFKDYLKANGIVQQITPPYTPQHNGVSERRNRTLLDMVRIYDESFQLCFILLGLCSRVCISILNMVPTKKVDKTPYELWYGKVPNLSYLKVSGCEALIKRDTPDKLKQRYVKCIFIGYPKETMGYYFYFLPENKIVVARYAEFFEKRLISQEISGRAVDLEEIQKEEDTTPSEITSNIPQEVEGFKLHKPHRGKVKEHSLGDLGEPANYKAAMLDPESKNDIRAIRILISITAFYDYEIWQMDVKTTFLNGYLDEDIYMVQPEGFVDPIHPRKVCKLQRSIYGLKQASRS